MSSWGRCQDALYAVLDGYEYSSRGDWKSGLLQDKLTFDEISALIEPIIEAVYPIAHEQGMIQQRHEDAKARQEPLETPKRTTTAEE